MEFKNTSDKPCSLTVVGLGRVPPGGVVELPEELWLARWPGNGLRHPSVIEQVAPQMRPTSVDDEQVWYTQPAPTMPGSSRLRGHVGAVELSQMPPGVQEAVKARRARKDAPATAPGVEE